MAEPQQIHPPAVVERPPAVEPSAEMGGASRSPAGNGIDYPDELRPGQPVNVTDAISEAVGSPLYVMRPGKSLMPWAAVRDRAGVEDQIEFSRLYPGLKPPLVVDRFDATRNLAPGAAMVAPAEVKKTRTFLQEADERRALCEANGHAYVALFRDDQVDKTMFEAARLRVGKTSVPPTQVFASTNMTVAAADLLTQRIGELLYRASVGPDLLPWAWEPVGAFRRPLRFGRAYPQTRLLVDFRAGAVGLQEERFQAEFAIKRQLAEANGWRYLIVRASLIPSQEEIDRLLGRNAVLSQAGLEAAAKNLPGVKELVAEPAENDGPKRRARRKRHDELDDDGVES